MPTAHWATLRPQPPTCIRPRHEERQFLSHMCPPISPEDPQLVSDLDPNCLLGLGPRRLPAPYQGAWGMELQGWVGKSQWREAGQEAVLPACHPWRRDGPVLAKDNSVTLMPEGSLPAAALSP